MTNNLKGFEEIKRKLLKKLFLQSIILSVFSVFLTATLIFILFINYQKNNLKKEIHNFINEKKVLIKNRVITLSREDIDETLQLATEKTKDYIKRRVNRTYQQLLSIDKVNIPDKRKIAIKYLNNLDKYKNDNNYIFAYDATTGVMLVHKIKSLIGKSIKNIKLKSGENSFEKNKQILKNYKGFYYIYFYKPGYGNKKFLKIDYIRYVPEFNIVIGSGDYIDDIKKMMIKNIYQRISVKKFEKDNYFFILKPNGILSIDSIKKFVGKNVLNLKDKKGKCFNKEIIQKALHNKNGAFVKYYWMNPNTHRIEKNFLM